MLRIAEVTHLDQGSLAVVQQSVLLQRAKQMSDTKKLHCMALGADSAYQLDIPIHHPNLMAVIKGYDELLEKPPSLVFLKAIPLLDILKHVPARSELHGNAKELICQKDFLELYDVGMKKPIMVEQFPLNILCDLQSKHC